MRYAVRALLASLAVPQAVLLLTGCSTSPPIAEVGVAGIRLEDAELRARYGDPVVYDFFVRPGPSGRWELLVLSALHRNEWNNLVPSSRAEHAIKLWTVPIPRRSLELDPSRARLMLVDKYFEPRSFLLDPTTNTASPTNPSDWITDDPANPRPATATCSDWQAFYRPIKDWVPVPRRGLDRFIIDRSHRFYARVTYGPSVESAFGSRPFRRGDVGQVYGYVFFYDLQSDVRVSHAVRMEPGADLWWNVEPVFTHDSKYIICFAHGPQVSATYSFIWIMPTGLPSPEEPWTPPERTTPRRLPPGPVEFLPSGERE